MPPDPIERGIATVLQAQEKSMRLLRSWLTPLQKQQLREHQYFDVIGCDTGKRYRIEAPQGAYNIGEFDHGKIVAKLCFVPRLPVLPLGDIWLIQKLALELDEAATLLLANRSPCNKEGLLTTAAGAVRSYIEEREPYGRGPCMDALPIGEGGDANGLI